MELNMYELAEQLKQLREEKKDAELYPCRNDVFADNKDPCIRCGRT